MMAAVKLLRELIALPSVNPAFLPADHRFAGEHWVADFLLATAGSAGLDVERQPVVSKRDNIIMRLTPSGRARRRILLAPHMDTVGATEVTERLFKPVKRKDHLCGRGACDTKGSIAAMLTALTTVAAKSNRPKETEIVLAGLVDEEHSQLGSRALVQSGWRADLAIVGEPTLLQVVTAHKGDVWLKVETQGKSAHGARPELGRNAIHSMSRIVDLLETEYAASLKKQKHPLLGTGTVNVGTITGGTQPNVVPAHCSIGVDRRTLPGETEATVRSEVRALFKKHGLPAKLINLRKAACLPMETDACQPLVQELLKTAGQRRPRGVDFFCDAAVLVNGGIPSVVFGPGNIAQAHTADEWISLKSLEGATRLLTRFLQAQP